MPYIPDLMSQVSRDFQEKGENTLRDNPIVAYVHKRTLSQNKNFMAAFVGETGGGKSYAAITLAMKLDPDFTADRIVFTPKDFMALVNSDLPPGSVIIFDEAGVSMDSRSWYSMMNKLINYVLQTFRYKNLVVIFTVPLTKFIDSNARTLLHAYVIMKKVSKSEGCSYGSFYMLQVNYHTGQVYTKKPRILHGNEQIRIDYMRFFLPPALMLKKYEERRAEFTSKLYASVEGELQLLAQNDKKLTYKEMIDEVMLNLDKYRSFKKGVPCINAMRIAAQFSVGKAKAQFVKDMCENMLGDIVTPVPDAVAVEDKVEDL